MARGENIRQRKDGRWEGRFRKVRKDGKKVQGSVYGSSYREVKNKLIQIKAEQILMSEHLAKSGGSCMARTSETYAAIAEEWLLSVIPTLKPATISKYRSTLEHLLLPRFGQRKVITITRSEVLIFKNELLSKGGRTGRGYTPKSVCGILSVFKNSMDYARHVLNLPVIPLDGISIKQTYVRPRVLSVNEYRTLLDYLLTDITPIKLGVLLSLMAGLRIGEICALTWADISFADKCIHISKTMQRIQQPKGSIPRTKVIRDTPKSLCSSREIPITEELLPLLTQFRQPDACFLLTGDADSFMEPRCLENHFNAMIRNCSIEGVTMHTCRHSFATRCVELGFDVKTLSEILGHASVSITMNRYMHPSMDLKRENMSKLSSLFRT